MGDADGDDAEEICRRLEEEKEEEAAASRRHSAGLSTSTAYENMGIVAGGGSSNSTLKKRSAAIDKYNAFANDVHLPSWDDTKADDFCQEERIQKFTYWLINVYTKKDQKDKEKEALMKNTVTGTTNYFVQYSR